MRGNRRPGRPVLNTRYSQKTLMHDREYGFYWYAWLWKALRPLLILSISLIIVLGVVSTGWGYVYNHFFMPVNPQDTQVREFVIEPGTAISTIGENLVEQGYIKDKTIFKYMVQFQELTNRIQAGTYPLSSAMDINQVLKILAVGSAPNERTITIIPGWSIEDIANYLLQQQAISNVNEFLNLCKDANQFEGYSFSLQEAIQSRSLSGRKYALEGYLAPDTYRVYRNATPEAIIQRLLGQFDTVRDSVLTSGPPTEIVVDEEGNRLDSEGNIMTDEPAVFETPLNMAQTIILASVIEKEAGKTADFDKVSAVFHNRLQKGMRLESDATIAYALGIKRIVLTSAELNTDSLYNTYLNAGLPLGPICNPSKRALQAALYPNMDYINGEYLYFCSGDPAKGELHFSKTKAEHDAAVAQYRPLWIDFDRRQAGS